MFNIIFLRKIKGNKNVTWEEITAEEFRRLKESPEGKSKYFVELMDYNSENPSENKIIIEATKEQYEDWKKEKNHKSYLYKNMINSNIKTVSADCPIDTENNSDDLYSFIPDDFSIEDCVTDSIMIEKLRKALKSLDKEDMELINLLFFRDNGKMKREDICKTLNISKSTLFSRRDKVLAKLKEKLGEI